MFYLFIVDQRQGKIDILIEKSDNEVHVFKIGKVPTLDLLNKIFFRLSLLNSIMKSTLHSVPIYFCQMMLLNICTLIAFYSFLFFMLTYTLFYFWLQNISFYQFLFFMLYLFNHLVFSSDIFDKIYFFIFIYFSLLCFSITWMIMRVILKEIDFFCLIFKIFFTKIEKWIPSLYLHSFKPQKFIKADVI